MTSENSSNQSAQPHGPSDGPSCAVAAGSAYSRGYYAGCKKAAAVIAENRHLRYELKRLRSLRTGAAPSPKPDEQEEAIEYLLKTSSTLAAAAKLLIEARTNARPNIADEGRA